MVRLGRCAIVVGVAITTVAAAVPKVVLSGAGLAVGGAKLTFAKTSRVESIRVVSSALGKPTKTGSYGDCGQGDVIDYAKFRSGFELSFIKDKLSGWTQDTPALSTSNGVHVGITVAALRKVYPDVFLDKGDEANGGPSATFQREQGPNGWIESVRPSARVTGLFAGATCLPGI